MQCLLDNLLLSKDENGEGLSMQSLRDQLMTLLVAGKAKRPLLTTSSESLHAKMIIWVLPVPCRVSCTTCSHHYSCMLGLN